MKTKFVGLMALLALMAAALWYVSGGGVVDRADSVGNPEAYFVSESIPDQEALALRSKSRWEGIISGDMKRAYLHASPTYRSVYDFAHYQNQYGGQIDRQRVKVVSVALDPEDGNTAEVEVLLFYKTSGFQPGTTIDLTSYLEEAWIKEEGQWWYVEPR